MFVCEGEDLMQAALAAGIRPVEVLVDAERPPLMDGLDEVEPVEPRLLADVSVLAHPPRVLAIFRSSIRSSFLPPGCLSGMLSIRAT